MHGNVAPVCAFGVLTMALYRLNPIHALTSQRVGKPEHDRHSGTAHPMRVMRLLQLPVTAETELVLHLWVEPFVVLAAALALRFAVHETQISTRLFIAAPSFWLKEALNYWFRLRQRKRQVDIFNAAEDEIDPIAGNSAEDPLPKASARRV